MALHYTDNLNTADRKKKITFRTETPLTAIRKRHTKAIRHKVFRVRIIIRKQIYMKRK